MKKNNKVFLLGLVTAFVAVLSLSLVSGTYAKYSSTISGSDTARVAKWAFSYQGQDMMQIADHNNVKFDLFKTVLDSDGKAENDILPSDGSIIAPGTKGSFDLVFANNSEVTANYAVDFTATNEAGIPIQYSLDGSKWVDSIDELDIAASEETVLAINSAAKTVTIHWQWAFDGNDTYDTNLGLNGTALITVKASITFAQVD